MFIFLLSNIIIIKIIFDTITLALKLSSMYFNKFINIYFTIKFNQFSAIARYLHFFFFIFHVFTFFDTKINIYILV